MLKILFLFSLMFFFKTIFISHFYSNYLMFIIYPIEIASLSFINNNRTLSDKKNLEINNYLQWIFINWIGCENDYKILKDIEKTNIETSIIFLSWGFSFVLYQIYYLISNKIKKNINKISWGTHNIKYLLINYFSLFLWNFNSLLNLNNNTFIIGFLNVLLFNVITFWFPGIIFNFIYGEYLYYYRINYSFLIDDYKLKYKFFTIILLSLKFLSGFYLILFKFFNIESKFLLFLILSIYYYLLNKYNIFKKPYKFNINICLSISSLIILLSIFENYFEKDNYFLIFKIIFMIIYLILIFNFKRKYFKFFIEENLIQMENII